MAYEIIKFTIADPLLSTLKGLAGENSIHLTAKRLVTEILEGKEPTIEPDRLAELESKLEKLENLGSSVIAPHALAKIGDRLEALEENLEENMGFSADDLDKLTDEIKNRILSEGLKLLGDRLNQLEAGQPEFHETINNLVERIENLEGWISSLRDDRALAKGSLAKFSDRLDALEKGSTPKPLREIPTGLTHKEMSAICGDAPSVLGKLAKNRERWPEGYVWSDESKKWFPMEV